MAPDAGIGDRDEHVVIAFGLRMDLQGHFRGRRRQRSRCVRGGKANDVDLTACELVGFVTPITTYGKERGTGQSW
jgi:hypothetical protein